LTGFVLNTPQGVIIEVEGDERALEAFQHALLAEAPPLSVIEHLAFKAVPLNGDKEFRILESDLRAQPTALVSPDVATCSDCLRELFDPSDRRYRYPFLNCTNCGPRFTIIISVPYDRERTTMAAFAMCPECAREYHDPSDRRFHAQPIACPRCGPQVRLVDPSGRTIPCDDPIKEAARRLLSGQLLAVKGLGGYHLACDAANEEVVRRLRESKHREFKPFALMVPDVATAHQLVFLTPEAERELTSWRRPIVLARRRPDAPVAEGVAPHHRDLGLMLPYSPLHHLLLSEVRRPLVMTSGNLSDEPIAYKDEDALQRLGPMVDALLTHNRKIHIRCDDSVLRVVRGRTVIIRRSRGYAPQPLFLPFEAPVPLLAVGAMLKNTFALCRDRFAFVSHHIGDLDNYAAYRAFVEGIEHFKGLFALQPEVVAYDLHPDYPSTHYALEGNFVERYGVQHHHAHVAAVMAEYGLLEPVIGIAYDGTGYGTDGTIWGGEILLATYTTFERAAHLEPVKMPGGEKAVRQAWRMAAAWLWKTFGDEGEKLPLGIPERVGKERWKALWQLLRSDLPSPITTSVGRLFDAVASLLGICDVAHYEGQPAIWLEMAAEEEEETAYPVEVITGTPMVMSVTPLMRALVTDILRGEPVGRIAAKFHNSLIMATVEICHFLRQRTGIDSVVLSGGVMQNAFLLQRLWERLEKAGFAVFVPQKLPPNDGGICYGQAAIAAQKLRKSLSLPISLPTPLHTQTAMKGR